MQVGVKVKVRYHVPKVTLKSARQWERMTSFQPPYLTKIAPIFFNSASADHGLLVPATENLARSSGGV